MPEQTTAFFPAKPKPTAEAINVRHVLRARAQAEARKARAEWFSQRCREMGGFTPRTREQILRECDEVERHAREAVYLAHGYTKCSFCESHLASPGYDLCPYCGPA